MVPFVINLTRWWSCQPLIHQVSPSLGSSPSPVNKSCPGLKLGSYSYRMLLSIIWSMGWCKSTRMFLGFSSMNRGLLCSELSIHISEENVVHSWTNDKVSTNVQPNPLAYLRITMRSISDFLVQFGYVNTLHEHSVVLLLPAIPEERSISPHRWHVPWRWCTACWKLHRSNDSSWLTAYRAHECHLMFTEWSSIRMSLVTKSSHKSGQPSYTHQFMTWKPQYQKKSSI